MKLPAFSRKLNPRERLLVIMAAGVVLIGVAYAMLDSEEGVATQVPSRVSANVADAAQRPVMPKGYQPDMKVKDPFAAAPEYVPPAKAADIGKNAAPYTSDQGITPRTVPQKTAEQTKSSLPEVRLTGVAGADGSYVAIIQMGNKSQPYAVNETVGPYRVIAINENSAILQGPGGQKVIQLGR